MGRSVISRRLGEDGAPAGFVVVTRDITEEHRRAEQERVLADIADPLTASLDRSAILTSVAGIVVRELADACVLDLLERPKHAAFVKRSRIAWRDPAAAPLWGRLEEMSVDPRCASLGRTVLATKQASVVTHITPEYLDALAPND